MNPSHCLALVALANVVLTPAYAGNFRPKISLQPIGTYESGVFDEGAAEIVAFDPSTDRVFVMNANDASVDVLSLDDPSNPQWVSSIDVTAASNALGNANSVAVADGILAVAVERVPKQRNGVVAFYETQSLAFLGTVEVGALPDMVTFTPNGRKVLVANEGEPGDDYRVDPEGSISIIDISRGIENAQVSTVDFRAFNDKKDQLIAKGVRIFGPGASVAQDLEPEYITVARRGRTAYVALQEANAIAVVDIRRSKVVEILPLGTKDHSEAGNELDTSDRDGGIKLRNWPVVGMFQPDSIGSYWFRGRTFIVTANEGDSRDYDGYSEEERVGDLNLDAYAYPDAATLQLDENLGRLKTTTATGDSDGDGLIEQIHSYGARSFAIWSTSGKLIYDSGSDFEALTSVFIPDNFNSTNDEQDSFDNRSDDKGPEPEGLVLGRFLGRTYAFVGLERVGGIMAYDITNPYSPVFQTYVNNRDFNVAAVSVSGAGDVGPEGLVFVPWWQSPNYRALLIVGSEVSGTTTVYQLGLTWRWW